MTENDKRQIISLWESGVALEQIYQMLPYKRYHAFKMVRELRADGTLKPRKKAERAIELVALAWQTETKDIDELAEMFGYNPSTIDKYLQLSGVREGKRQPNSYKISDKTHEIIAELETNTSLSEIARKFGVSRQYVHQIKIRLEKENGNRS
jgi:transposase